MILDRPIITSRGRYAGNGYIAGNNDGILTLAGQAARRNVWLIATDSMQIVDRVWTTSAGHYLFAALSTDHQYLVIGRDNQMQCEPHAWDYVTPATDLTVEQQLALWQSWQT